MTNKLILVFETITQRDIQIALLVSAVLLLLFYILVFKKLSKYLASERVLNENYRSKINAQFLEAMSEKDIPE